MPILKTTCAAGLIFVLASCGGFRGNSTKVPHPVDTPAVAADPPKPPPAQKTPPQQPQIPPPEVSIDTQPPTAVPPALEQAPQLPAPPKPTRRRRRPTTAQAQAAPAPQSAAEPVKPQSTQAAPAESEEAPATSIQLVPLLSEDAQKAYEQAIAELISKAEQNLAAAKARNPNAQQRVLMDQARRFIAQSKEIRKKDLPAAKSLAERAEIVSREVLGQF